MWYRWYRSLIRRRRTARKDMVVDRKWWVMPPPPSKDGLGRTLMAILVRCLISDGKIQELSYVPGTIRGHGPPDFTRPSQSEEVVKRIAEMSSPFGTRFEVREEEVAVVLEHFGVTVDRGYRGHRRVLRLSRR